jgi:hypothetical protein
MRTKALLAAATMLAAGFATSLAQSNVYSLNVVGYVNVVLEPGFTMIGNPLNSTSNTLNNLIPNPGVGSIVYKFNGSFNPIAENFGPGLWDINLPLAPGEGAFIYVPARATNTFVGEVLQGPLTNQLPSGFSLVSSQVPQSAGLSSVLAFPAAVGDLVYRFNPVTQSYVGGLFESFGGNIWDPSEPVPGVGEAFFVQKAAAAPWTRNFTVQ